MGYYQQELKRRLAELRAAGGTRPNSHLIANEYVDDRLIDLMNKASREERQELRKDIRQAAARNRAEEPKRYAKQVLTRHHYETFKREQLEQRHAMLRLRAAARDRDIKPLTDHERRRLHAFDAHTDIRERMRYMLDRQI